MRACSCVTVACATSGPPHARRSSAWTSEWACPVCRAPTLRQRGAYEVCQVCWWEDDGIVDEGWPSGCNGRTLLEARRHFADGLMSCARSEDHYAQFGGGDAELEALKRQILTCAAGLRLLDDGPELAAGRRRLDELLAELEAATTAWLRRREQTGR